MGWAIRRHHRPIALPRQDYGKCFRGNAAQQLLGGTAHGWPEECNTPQVWWPRFVLGPSWLCAVSWTGTGAPEGKVGSGQPRSSTIPDADIAAIASAAAVKAVQPIMDHSMFLWRDRCPTRPLTAKVVHRMWVLVQVATIRQDPKPSDHHRAASDVVVWTTSREFVGQCCQDMDSSLCQMGTQVSVRLSKGKPEQQLVLSEPYRHSTLSGLHDIMGHFSVDRTLNLAWDRFFWPKMGDDVQKWVASCKRCICQKHPEKKSGPLVSIKTSQPMELACMDFLMLQTSKGSYDNTGHSTC